MPYFRVQIDSIDPEIGGKKLTFYYKSLNSAFHTLFPCNWCNSNNLRLCPPSTTSSNNNTSQQTDSSRKFDWTEFETKMLDSPTSATLPPGWLLYFTKSSDVHNLFNWSRTISQNAAEKFSVGAYLECADPEYNGDVVCLAQIKARVEHLIFVELLYRRRKEAATRQLYVFSVDSCDLFPLGWAEMNNFYEDRKELYELYLRFDDDSSTRMDEFISKTKPSVPKPLSNISMLKEI